MEKSLVGQCIGNYEVLRELGRGGMAVVYKAHEQSLQRMVALKVLPRHLSEDPVFVERFQREARAPARLSHPNIVTVYAVGEADGFHFIAMEYVKGKTLAMVIEEAGQIEVARALEIAAQAADALAEAHSSDIIHRDIKPKNILIDQAGRVKITDFGLAKVLYGVPDITETGILLGTPRYMSPEQCRGDKVDPRTDIYSLGVVLFEMLSGRPPYLGETPVSLIRQILDSPFPSLRELNPRVPEEVCRALGKMVARSPDDRYDSAESVRAEMKKLLRKHDAGPRETAPEKRLDSDSVRETLPARSLRFGRLGRVVRIATLACISCVALAAIAGLALLVFSPTLPIGRPSFSETTSYPAAPTSIVGQGADKARLQEAFEETAVAKPPATDIAPAMIQEQESEGSGTEKVTPSPSRPGEETQVDRSPRSTEEDQHSRRIAKRVQSTAGPTDAEIPDMAPVLTPGAPPGEAPPSPDSTTALATLMARLEEEGTPEQLPPPRATTPATSPKPEDRETRLDVARVETGLTPSLKPRPSEIPASPGPNNELARLVAQLKEKDPALRKEAEDALVRTGSPAVPLLIAMVREEEGAYRKLATDVLIRVGRPAVGELRRALGNEHPEVREQAVRALGELKATESLDELTAALQDRDRTIRLAAATALGQIADARAVGSLIAALGDYHDSVQEQAIWALGQIGDKRAVGSLIPMLGDGNPTVRKTAAEALGRIGDKTAVPALTAALQDSDTYVRSAARTALARIGQ